MTKWKIVDKDEEQETYLKRIKVDGGYLYKHCGEYDDNLQLVFVPDLQVKNKQKEKPKIYRCSVCSDLLVSNIGNKSVVFIEPCSCCLQQAIREATTR